MAVSKISEQDVEIQIKWPQNHSHKMDHKKKRICPNMGEKQKHNTNKHDLNNRKNSNNNKLKRKKK